MLERNPDITNDHTYLGLLARVKTALATAVEVSVPAIEVRPYTGQPRTYFDELAIRRLSDSIDASGQTTAGIIREKPAKTRYELIDGERRWRAIMLIPPKQRPEYRARLIRADDDVVQYLISGIANFNREGHAPLETSDTINRLIALGLPLREVSALLGISEIWAAQMRGLARLVQEVRAMLAPDLPKIERLPVTAAVEISKIEGKLQLGLAQRVMRRDVTLSGLRSEVVKVAREAESYVRTREIPPSKKWHGLKTKAGVLVRTSADAYRSLTRETLSFAQHRTANEIQEISELLADAQKQIAVCQAELEKILRNKRPAFRKARVA